MNVSLLMRFQHDDGAIAHKHGLSTSAKLAKLIDNDDVVIAGLKILNLDVEAEQTLHSVWLLDGINRS